MIRLIGGAVAVGMLVSLGLVSAAAAQSGGIGGRPANPDPKNPRTQSIFIYSLKRGATKTDQVRISNNSSKTQTIELGVVDAIVTNTGSFSCRQNSEEKTDIASAIQLAETQVTLEPKQNREIDFTVTMPETADVGEHNACLVFQSKQDEGEVEGNIRVRTRQAIRLVATVPGDLRRDVRLTSFSVRHSDNQQVLRFAAKNAGNVSADIKAKVVIRNIFGKDVYTNGGQYPILANEKLELDYVNTAKPFFGGWYWAHASLKYNKQAGSFGVSEANETIQRSAPSQVIFIAPTVAGIACMAAFVLLLVAALLMALQRHTQRKNVRKTWTEYTIKKNETITDIAQKHDIDWRTLARHNNLKPPYTLMKDEKIKVPNKSKV